jgi:hypothetical protein
MKKFVAQPRPGVGPFCARIGGRATMDVLRAFLIAAALASQAAPSPPDTEVFLASLFVRDAKIEIGKPINISNSPRYDNQPAFTPDGQSVLFTSVRGGRKPDPANSAATGSDIYRYEIATELLSQVTNTPESEYSPTVTPDGRHISVIRVEADGTQRLWRFALDGTQPEFVLRDINPVGDREMAPVTGLDGLGLPSATRLAISPKGDRIALVAPKP